MSDEDGPLRTIKMLAMGCLPALTAFALIQAGLYSENAMVNLSGFVAFGYLTPVVVANAKRLGSVFVAMLLAGCFLGIGTDTAPGFDIRPWWLFAWGLFPAIAVTLCIRLVPHRSLAWILPFALAASVVVRLLLPDAVLAIGALALLLADALVLRKFAKHHVVSTPP